MNGKRVLILAIAVVAGLLAAYLALGLRNKPEPAAPVIVQQKVDTVDVLVAAKNVSRGERLGEFSIEWRAWPRDIIAADLITRDQRPDAVEKLNGSRARLPLVVGEPILEAKIIRPEDKGFMSAVLPKGMRATAIPISEVSGVSGFILPNDRVDVLLTRSVPARSGQRAATTEVVLTNVKVLAINQSLNPGDDGATIPGPRTAVLELDPLQAQVLSKLTASGDLSLLLRSISEGGLNGLDDDKPVLSDAFMNPERAANGTLFIRYGLERTILHR